MNKHAYDEQDDTCIILLVTRNHPGHVNKLNNKPPILEGQNRTISGNIIYIWVGLWHWVYHIVHHHTKHSMSLDLKNCLGEIATSTG